MTCQPSESGETPLSCPFRPLWVLVGHRALDLELIAVCKASPPHAADDQALWAQWVATTPFIPKPPKMAICLAVSPIPPKVREAALKKRTMLKWVRARSRPQGTNRRHPRVKISRNTHTPKTPSLVLVSPLASMRTLTQILTLGRKSRPHGKGSTRTAPRKTPVGHCLQRKSCQLTRHFEMKLGKKRGCLTHASMLGIVTKLPTSRPGQHKIP